MPDIVIIGPAVIAILAYVYGYRTGRCSKDNPCAKCAFHTNERRMVILKAEQERVEYAKDQALLRHDYEHKGGGFMKDDPDKFNCADESCTRNKKRGTM